MIYQKEIETIERILSQEDINNTLIIGEPGSGRKSMVHALAEKSVLGESLPEVNYKRIVQLDLQSLLARTESTEEVENVLDTIFGEVILAGNVILVIDEFQNFVGGIVRPGVIDISGVLGSYLHLPQFQIVAITTFEGLHKNIEQNPSILSLFEKVEVSEISQRETLILLEKQALQLETKYKKFVSYPALRDIIKLCDKYLPAIPFPEKAMDLLNEIMVYVAQTKDKVVLPKHVAKIVSEKTEIPVGEVETKEREILLNLENSIHKRIINQEEAVREVSAALRRAKAEVTIRKGPMGSFLFLGPTGVGKTETSKALAEIYFGSENRMIRLDMSEFQNIPDIPRLIGSPGEEGLLTTQVREDPFSLILLDEIEKSHPNILNLFLQVLDEGHLTDGLGRKVDFKNTIITATSNAGYQIILEALKQGKKMSEIKEKLLDFLFKKGIFRPEFINRFDAVVVFKSLTKENLLDIAGLLLQKLKKSLSKKDIEFIITPQLKKKIVELSYDPKFGAREMRRAIQDKIGNVLAQALLSAQLKRGDRVEVRPEDFKLKINL
ncbi:MAG: AAA family ATPase [Candidatus Paceibacterales bacterium]